VRPDNFSSFFTLAKVFLLICREAVVEGWGQMRSKWEEEQGKWELLFGAKTRETRAVDW
jgi:hypothetical protein